MTQTTAALGLVALGICLAAWPAPAAADAKDARTVRRLQEKSGTRELIGLDASRGEIALALADVAAGAGTGDPAGDSWQRQDYDALFALLQQYREELAALGLKQTAVDAALEAMNKRIADLEQRMEYLPPDGMKVHGRFSVEADDMLITGPGQFLGNPNRFRHFKQHVSLEFTTVHGPFFGMTQFDLATYVGSYASPVNQGVPRVYAEIRTPIAIQTGDFDVSLTPFTLWRNEDEDLYEPEPFKGRTKRLKKYALIGEEGKVPIRGLRFATDAEIGGFTTLETELISSILGGPGDAVYQHANAISSAGAPAGFNTTSPVTAIYMTYLLGWRVQDEIVPGWKLAYQGSKIFDEQSTGNTKYDIAQLVSWTAAVNLDKEYVHASDNEVHSAATYLNLWDGRLKAEAEYAMSSYINPNVGVTNKGLTMTAAGAVIGSAPSYFSHPSFRSGGSLPGSAMHAKISVGEEWGKLTAHMRQVDQNFVVAAAQTRTMDKHRNPYGPFVTENIQYNPGSTAAQMFRYGGYGPPYYNQSILWGRIIPPNTYDNSDFHFNYLLPYDVGFNSTSPYGLATPNRQVYGAQLDFNLFRGLFQPMGRVDMGQQVVSEGGRAPEKYMTYMGGLVIDLKPALEWPVKFSGGYRLEDTRNSEWVAFDSTRLDLGLEYYPVESTGLFLGFRHLDYNGTIYNPDSTYAPLGMFGVHQLYECFGAGIRHTMGDRITMDILYTHQDFPNRDASLTFGQEVAYKIDQGYMQFSVEF